MNVMIYVHLWTYFLNIENLRNFASSSWRFFHIISCFVSDICNEMTSVNCTVIFVYLLLDSKSDCFVSICCYFFQTDSIINCGLIFNFFTCSIYVVIFMFDVIFKLELIYITIRNFFRYILCRIIFSNFQYFCLNESLSFGILTGTTYKTKVNIVDTDSNYK